MKKAIDILKSWFSNNIVRQYLQGSFWMTAARLAWIFSAFTIGIAVVRKLGPKDYGYLNYVAAYVGMFSVLANLGLDVIAERELLNKPENEGRILGNYFAFKLLSLATMLTALGLSFLILEDKSIIPHCLIVASGYMLYPFGIVQCLFFSKVKSRYNAWSQIVCCAIYNSIRVFAILNCSSIAVYFVAEAVLAGLSYGIMFVFYWRFCNSPLKWSFRWKEVMALIPLALPMSITVVFNMVYARTDMLMLEHYKGVEMVGFYTIAARFTENWTLFLQLFAQVFSAAVISARNISALEYSKQLHRYYFMLFWISLPPILLMLLLGRIICTLLYGNAFAVSASILHWHILTLPCNGLLMAFHCHAVCEHRLKIIAAVFCLGALINVPLNMLLIKHLGASGAAISSATAMPIGITLALICTHKGQHDLFFMLLSIFTLPSFRLGMLVKDSKEEAI